MTAPTPGSGTSRFVGAVEREQLNAALHIDERMNHEAAADERRVLDRVRLFGHHDLPRRHARRVSRSIAMMRRFGASLSERRYTRV